MQVFIWYLCVEFEFKFDLLLTFYLFLSFDSLICTIRQFNYSDPSFGRIFIIGLA